MKEHSTQMIVTEDAFITAAVTIIEGSSRYLRIRSALLDKALFDSPEVLHALSTFARHSRYSQIQILIDYPARFMQSGHGLLPMIQRLSQKIEVKVYYDEKDEHIDSTIIGDQGALLIKPIRQDKEGIYAQNVVKNRLYTEQFDHAWLRSNIAHEIRNISI